MTILESKNFYKDILTKTSTAKKHIYMQFLTFEGDSKGIELSKKLIKAAESGVDVYLQIDYFTDYFINDQRSSNEEVEEELQATKEMFKNMKDAGIKIKRTHPYGPFRMFAIARNHRKIVVIDEYSYLGGVNISEHNIEWADFMVRFKDELLKKELIALFMSSFENKKLTKKLKRVMTNKEIIATHEKLINEAKKTVVISSPYILDRSLIRRLSKTKADVSVFTAKNNNKLIVRLGGRHIKHLLQKQGSKLVYYTDFTHGKFILIDDKYLIIGSSNFDVSSLKYMEEVGILIEDKAFINDFKKKIIEPSETEPSEEVPFNFLYLIYNFMYEFVATSYVLLHRVLKFITMDRDKKTLFWGILFLGISASIGLAGVLLSLSLLEFIGVMSIGSTFIPVPADAYILSFAENHSALFIASLAGFINATVVILEKYWLIEALKYKRFKKLNSFFDNSKYTPLVHKNMFISLLIGGFSPLPFEIFRLIASKVNYNNAKYFLATFLGRGFRYYLLATSSVLLVEVGALSYVIGAILLLFAWGLYKSVKKWREV